MSKYKIIVVGSGSVGKSALTMRYIHQKFVERYDPTVEDSYMRQVEIDGSAVMLEIIDTAGQEEYRSLTGMYMEKGHGFVIVYSMTDIETFHETAKYYEEILKAKDEKEGAKIPIILVGNKIDLEDQRSVTKEEGENQSKKFGDFCKWIETSAKTGENVDSVFEELVRMINTAEGGEEEEVEEAAAEGAQSKPSAGTAASDPAQPGSSEVKPATKPKRQKKKCIIL
ncbi:hypothetical protein C9374_002647 [Naegleria lovaniensis]|uniref:Ras family small GTPase n=1 Tax=Naegleria lovaniensis TaxID=51637 RepID=A0AA88KM82_NAELO|nr:uncharacterized protein C9374_002647 [Naegleria lovaniensis]KAG2386201.1 hypothetical protein C9374_002647 [Naegleria lovaniensis]